MNNNIQDRLSRTKYYEIVKYMQDYKYGEHLQSHNNYDVIYATILKQRVLKLG